MKTVTPLVLALLVAFVVAYQTPQTTQAKAAPPVVVPAASPAPASCQCTCPPDTAERIATLEAQVRQLQAAIAPKQAMVIKPQPVTAVKPVQAVFSNSCANGSCGTGRAGLFGRRR